ncbi:hypothetical protein SAMN05421770_101729 [Granulicella rosea]|uniref:Uncharacterized protein n=1 Tax=Granulicella rosea TaxID=474952 RepID=A0A239E0P0_9BACT|nr:hypothetical protein SAMN05421770_101729 [Granulicella rosea]
MSAHSEASFLERWWGLLVIAYGVIFVTCICSWMPTW